MIIPAVIYVSSEQDQLTATAQNEAKTDTGPAVIIYYTLLKCALCM